TARQQAQRNAFAVNGRNGGNADVDFFAFNTDVDTTVLRETFFRDVHPRHNFDTGDERRLEPFQLRRHRSLVQNTVDTIANAQLVFGRFKMNVRRAIFESFPDDLVNELDDAGFLIRFGDFLVVDEQFERLIV